MNTSTLQINKLKTKYRFFTHWQETAPEIVQIQLEAIEKKLLELWIIATTKEINKWWDCNFKIKFIDAKTY